jgi:hypothetical protein
LNGGIHSPSLAVEDKPQQATEKKNDGRIEKYDWLDRRLKLTAHKKQAYQRCQDNRNDETDHPGGEERANYVEGWRSVTTG